MHVLILGDKSDIAKGLVPHFKADGWTNSGWNRYNRFHEIESWDLLLVALGRVSPVGLWFDNDSLDWEHSIESNFLLPMRLLREAWPSRKEGASVCFLAGSNPNKPMKGYSAYHAGKMALVKTVEQLDAETEGVKFFALAPGYVDTKIHKPTLEAGWENARIAKGGGTKIEDIYRTLSWCLGQPKEIIGGRNICVTDLFKDGTFLPIGMGPELYERLEGDSSLFKLRRYEG